MDTRRKNLPDVGRPPRGFPTRSPTDWRIVKTASSEARNRSTPSQSTGRNSREASVPRKQTSLSWDGQPVAPLLWRSRGRSMRVSALSSTLGTTVRQENRNGGRTSVACLALRRSSRRNFGTSCSTAPHRLWSPLGNIMHSWPFWSCIRSVQKHTGLADFEAFFRLFGAPVPRRGTVGPMSVISDVRLYGGWVSSG